VTLAGDIIRGKALDLLVDKADISDTEPDTTTQPDTVEDTDDE
jgi:hypothetical protein